YQRRRVARNAPAVGVIKIDDIARKRRARQTQADEFPLMRNLDAGAATAWQEKRIAGLDHRLASVRPRGDMPHTPAERKHPVVAYDGLMIAPIGGRRAFAGQKPQAR